VSSGRENWFGTALIYRRRIETIASVSQPCSPLSFLTGARLLSGRLIYQVGVSSSIVLLRSVPTSEHLCRAGFDVEFYPVAELGEKLRRGQNANYTIY
jgi:hypothetical protein